jgi:hypothetical protein
MMWVNFFFEKETDVVDAKDSGIFGEGEEKKKGLVVVR